MRAAAQQIGCMRGVGGEGRSDGIRRNSKKASRAGREARNGSGNPANKKAGARPAFFQFDALSSG